MYVKSISNRCGRRTPRSRGPAQAESGAREAACRAQPRRALRNVQVLSVSTSRSTRRDRGVARHPARASRRSSRHLRLVEATNGAVVFDGRDMTYAPRTRPRERGASSSSGQGVFPPDCGEQLRLAGWVHRKTTARVELATPARAELFPSCANGCAAGGQPLRRPAQMLALGMAFIEQPRLLMIDELSLGLAPAIVSSCSLSCATWPRREHDRARQQSVTSRSPLRRRRSHGEGEIRFHVDAELLDRPDVFVGVPRRRGQPSCARPNRPRFPATVLPRPLVVDPFPAEWSRSSR